MQVPDESQRSVLLALYAQEQSTAFFVRERMAKVTVATVGLFLAVSGWTVAKPDHLITEAKIAIVAALPIVLGAAIFGVRARYAEFCTVAQMIVRIERALGVYEPDLYLPGEPLYCDANQMFGEDEYAHSISVFQKYLFVLVSGWILSTGIVWLV